MSKNRLLEDIAKVSRRKALTLLGGAGASLLVPGLAKAELECKDYFDFFEPYTTCKAGIDSDIIYSNALESDKLKTNQEKSMWCWAACLEMIFNYWGYEVPQKRIVEETKGSAVNLSADSKTILMNLNRDWVDDKGEWFSVFGSPYSTNVSTVIRDLSDNNPLIIGTHNHAMVLTEVVYTIQKNPHTHEIVKGKVDSAAVIDPWPGRGKRGLNAREWHEGKFIARIRVSPDKRRIF